MIERREQADDSLGRISAGAEVVRPPRCLAFHSMIELSFEEQGWTTKSSVT
jgi:hypothetical protein